MPRLPLHHNKRAITTYSASCPTQAESTTNTTSTTSSNSSGTNAGTSSGASSNTGSGQTCHNTSFVFPSGLSTEEVDEIQARSIWLASMRCADPTKTDNNCTKYTWNGQPLKTSFTLTDVLENTPCISNGLNIGSVAWCNNHIATFGLLVWAPNVAGLRDCSWKQTPPTYLGISYTLTCTRADNPSPSAAAEPAGASSTKSSPTFLDPDGTSVSKISSKSLTIGMVIGVATGVILGAVLGGWMYKKRKDRQNAVRRIAPVEETTSRAQGPWMEGLWVRNEY